MHELHDPRTCENSVPCAGCEHPVMPYDVHKTLIELSTNTSEDNGGRLRRRVALEALEEEDPIEYLKNAAFHIADGGVNGLIYYTDTHKFFDEFYSEIQEMVYEYEHGTGEKVFPTNDIKNFYAWFAYEQMARWILSELDIEY